MRVGVAVFGVLLLIVSTVTCGGKPKWSLQCVDLNKNEKTIYCRPSDKVFKIKSACAKNSGVSLNKIGVKHIAYGIKGDQYMNYLDDDKTLSKNKVIDGATVVLFEILS